MSVSFWQDYNSIAPSKVKEFDIIIIGGGIAGLSSAYWLLQEDPNSKIALIEKNEIGDAASGRNAGFITCGSVEHFNRLVLTHGEEKARKIWEFSETNLSLIEERVIRPSGALSLDFEQNGSFSLASTQEEFKELKTSFDIMKAFNIDVEVLYEGDIKTRLGAKGFVGGIKYKKDASINPMKLLSELKAKLLKTKNFELFENSEVFNISDLKDKKLIKTKKDYFSADAIVLATNAYSGLIHPYFEDKILPTRGQILTTSSVPRFMEGPCYANFVLDYFRQLPTGQVIIGGFRQLQKEVETGYSDETSPLIQKALEEFLIKHIPEVAKAKITHRWSGIMGFSSDGDPMIGSIPSDNQIYFLGGFTAHGLGLAFHAGKCLTDLIYGRKIPDFISAKRF